jgi:SAM-dependent methyltransferase
MVSSPFGGVDAINSGLLDDTFRRLDIDIANRAVLDIGCGRGYIGEIVRARGGRYTGLDLVPSRGGFALSIGDAAALPYRDAAFDAVFCIDAFEHIPDPVRAAHEMRRVLRPGGFVFLSTPNYGNVAGLVKRWCERFGAYEKNAWAPFGRWQAQEWETPLTFRRVRGIFRAAEFDEGRVVSHAAEIGLGVCPWMDHPRAPDFVRFRLQRFFNAIGPGIAKAWPSAGLHGFWKWS